MMHYIQVEGCLRCQIPQARATPDKEKRGMNKSQLIEALAKAKNITLKKAEIVVNALFENMTDGPKHEERIEIRGFGSFNVKCHSGYKGRNSKTGDLIKVEGKKLTIFKVGMATQEICDRLNAEGTSARVGKLSNPVQIFGILCRKDKVFILNRTSGVGVTILVQNG
jgi:integration host factor subunit beta